MIGLGLERSAHLSPPKLHQIHPLSSASSFLLSSSHGYSTKLFHLKLLNNRSFYVRVGRGNQRRALFPVSVSKSPPDASPEPQLASHPNREDAQRKVPDVQTLARRFWEVAAPYWSSDDKVGARWRLAAVFALTLGTTGISVVFNYLGRDFYNALANKDQEQFTKQLLYYLFGFATGIPLLMHYTGRALSSTFNTLPNVTG